MALTSELAPVLQNCQQSYWQRFSESSPETVEQLSNEQINLYKYAFTLSDFVFTQISTYPEWALDLLSTDLTEPVDFKGLLSASIEECKTEDELMRCLRLFRRKYLTAIAIADLCHKTPLETSLSNLSSLADCLIEGALNWLSIYCKSLWGTPQNSLGEEQSLLVYAMGKLGGKELNFSSDIDLIFAYPDTGETVGHRRALDNQQYFTRLGQKLINALNQVTADGFVFRVDMRLRPFGDSGPLVMSFSAIENYYQDQGRDWERYAMLKARLIGNSIYHNQLSTMLRPFVYRRYIDFSVIESFRRMKLMISQEARRRQLQNNIKLGAGGIREIEFIVQVFQLIRGGREAQLQQRSLLKALPLLTKYDCISSESEQVLRQAYDFLRHSENAIQAFNDQQTQQLPDEELNQARLSHYMACDNWQDYLSKCHGHMELVNSEFNLLIGEESEQSNDADEHWVTYWHADWQDEEAINWIEQSQANWPCERIHHLIKHFKLDAKKRSIGQRGRIILDKLVPVLLGLLVDENDPEITLERTLLVLSRITTRTAYLELLYENAPAFKHLLKLCRASEWIAEYLAKFPILLDELIDPKLLYALPELNNYSWQIKEALMRIPEDDLEAQMEGLRQFKQVKQLKIAAADITGILPVMQVSDHLTALAQATTDEVVNMAWQQMVHRYGQPKSTIGSTDKKFAVLGYGKLGGIELGYGSDLDLVFVHNCPNDETDGQKCISSMQFYLKLAQRIQHLFNTRTASGILYEADMRLRPSGDSGPMVVHIDSYQKYLQQEAWTWEHQALVRARFICGDEQLHHEFNRIRKSILQQQREQNVLADEVVKMRERMREHLDKSTEQTFDIKQCKGGLADIEFLAQYLVLANSHAVPNLTEFTDNVRIFEGLITDNLLSQEQGDELISSYCSLRDLGHSLVLQNKAATVDNENMLKERENVSTIWNEYLGN
ncbi:bifunctional [glutamate--ammonia ligase]-adenylyl-L-tyrosine phosphorylase/[glutamate--ammonia-ligase] adenylyltransferase [Thalassomonas sp. M1454]|nr:bifunctional [glutamate--ammonia ligase]-adenylyl-L-tyrosine phosphorylase/[glutamate--ammonia-ligase] adenylyltransferase [Thalassomonas sp. M1454]